MSVKNDMFFKQLMKKYIPFYLFKLLLFSVLSGNGSITWKLLKTELIALAKEQKSKASTLQNKVAGYEKKAVELADEITYLKIPDWTAKRIALRSEKRAFWKADRNAVCTPLEMEEEQKKSWQKK